MYFIIHVILEWLFWISKNFKSDYHININNNYYIIIIIDDWHWIVRLNKRLVPSLTSRKFNRIKIAVLTHVFLKSWHFYIQPKKGWNHFVSFSCIIENIQVRNAKLRFPANSTCVITIEFTVFFQLRLLYVLREYSRSRYCNNHDFSDYWSKCKRTPLLCMIMIRKVLCTHRSRSKRTLFCVLEYYFDSR